MTNLEWKERFTYVKNVPFDENDLKCKGARFQVVKFEPHTSIEPHYHKRTTEIFYIREGNGKIMLNKEQYDCRTDTFFLCEPGDVHSFINDTDDDLVR